MTSWLRPADSDTQCWYNTRSVESKRSDTARFYMHETTQMHLVKAYGLNLVFFLEFIEPGFQRLDSLVWTDRVQLVWNTWFFNQSDKSRGLQSSGGSFYLNCCKKEQPTWFTAELSQDVKFTWIISRMIFFSSCTPHLTSQHAHTHNIIQFDIGDLKMSEFS